MIRSALFLPQFYKAFSYSLASFSSAVAPKRPLNIFVCATDVSSDRAAAALVGSFKQLHKHGVRVYGLGGPALLSQGLHSIVSDEQYHQLATAEIVSPVHSYVSAKLPLPGVQQVSKSQYLKIFRDVIWEAALHGCGSRSTPAAAAAAASAQQQQASKPQQQQQQEKSKVVGGLPAEISYDAVLTVGSPLASQQLLFALRQAEKANVARLPVIVQYMPPNLWDHTQASSSAKAWSQLVDHVMCSLPFEPAVMHQAGTPASFVGHPVLEPILQRGHFSNAKRQIAQMVQQLTAGEAGSSGSSTGSSSSMPSLFAVGNAAAFWKDFDRLVMPPDVDSSSSSSSSPAGVGSSRKRRAAPPAAALRNPKQDRPQLLCLLPGSTEAEICSSMPAFDLLTRDLQQTHPNIAVAVIVPDLLVEATREAIDNFTVPAIVAPEDFVLTANALAAAAAAISHPGVQCLRAVAAGVPIVCILEGSSILNRLLSWRKSKVLQFGSIPNSISGFAVVPELDLSSRGGQQSAVEAVGRLLTAAAESAGPGSSSSSSSNEWQQQRAALREMLLRLVPPLGQQQTAAAAAAAASVQAPSEAAAAMLLELITLRQQQEAEQLQTLFSSSSSSI